MSALLRVVSPLAFLGAVWSLGLLWTRSASPGPLAPDWPWRMTHNTILFLVFATHHSVWPRPAIKQRLMVALGETERPLYVLAASALLGLVAWLWTPLGGSCYALTPGLAVVARGVQVAGVLVAAAALRHTNGLALIDARLPETRGDVTRRGPYAFVRHPLYLGLLLALAGAPQMTPDRALLIFLIAFYVVVAIPLEERTLRASLGSSYDEYRVRVRARLVPGLY